MKRPSFQFYPGDWLNDAALRMCSVGARGLWIDMLCLMHQGSPYGHLKVNNKAISIIQLGRMVGANEGEVSQWIAELEDAGVFSRSDAGEIYSRRMVKDEELRAIRAAGGKEGGNPALIGEYNEPGYVYAMQRSSDLAVKIGISKHPAKRAYKIRQQFPDDAITVLGQKYVPEMGKAEAELHSLFASKKSGEWFSLDQGDISVLLSVHLKGNAKENAKEKGKASTTPSSSSSSSSSNSIKSSKEDLSPADAEDDQGDIEKGKPEKIPYQEIINLYHEVLPEKPRVVKLNDNRRRSLKARFLTSPKTRTLEWWRNYFEAVRERSFLMNGKGDWPGADFDFLITESKFLKIIEGGYQ